MRKRGEAAARNGTLFDGGKPGLPSAANPAGLKFYECRCGLVQTWNNGTCRGCAKSLMGCPTRDEAPLVQDVRREPEMSAGVAKAMAGGDNLGRVGVNEPPGLPPKTEAQIAAEGPMTKHAPRPVRLALEDDFSALAIRLQAKGIEWKGKPLSLVQLSKWTPEHRRAAAMWLERMADKPAFLENGLIDGEEIVHRDVKPGNVLAEDVLNENEVAKVVAHIEAEDKARFRQKTIEALGGARLDEVDVTWGEEKFTPIPGSYSTCTVGPFSMTAAVRPDQTRAEAVDRAYAALVRQAEAERARKLESFIRVLNDARGKVGQ